MAPLINFPIDLTRTAAALSDINKSLVRIADALDRIEPPPLPLSRTEPYKAGLSDLRYTDTQTVSKVREELGDYAQQHSLMIDSEAFLNSIMQYERDITTAYGPNAILELPWNKAAGGALFGTQAPNEAAKESSPDQSGAGIAEAEAREVKTD